ncbi:MAG: ribosome biogenesis GTP-binding protein YihA/YsxC [Acidobacteriota bacterium]
MEATVADHRKGPAQPFPQVAFAGRSNVGKSSLLNTLFGRTLAGVSKDPGKTRTLNYYLVNRRLYFVDLPGYGYAKVARSERERWDERITAFLVGEPRLRLVIGLVDPRIDTSPLDVGLASFVAASGKPLLVVLTKADKLSAGALARAAARVTRDLALVSKPLRFSAHTGAGKKDILAAIADVLAA